MNEFLLLGSAVGMILGIIHGISVYRQIAERNSTGNGPSGALDGLYYALWTLVLWTLFGSYVLLLWLLGILSYPIVRILKGYGAADREPASLEHAK